MSAIDKVHHEGWYALRAQVDAHLSGLSAHPARSVLLLPFFQLQAVVREVYAAKTMALTVVQAGFLPRIETTQSWANRVAVFQPDALDISFDTALDALTARVWLEKAGLQAKLSLLAPLLLESVYQIAPLVASVPPGERSEWAAQLRQTAFAVDAAAESFASYEAAVARIALEWAAASSYASDVLFDEVQKLDALVVVRGVQSNPLTERLVQLAGSKVLCLDLPQAQGCEGGGHAAWGQVYEQVASDFEAQAQQAAACVLAHVAEGRTPVALPAIDRQATRRISALLLEQGVAVRDETGWQLSTTRSAAALMSVLRAARHDASPDELLDALKHTEAPSAHVQAWESTLRGLKTLKTSNAAVNNSFPAIKIGVVADAISAQEWLQRLRKPRGVQAWLIDLRMALEACGLWRKLQCDEAGQQLIEALHLDDQVLRSDSILSLSEFSQWVQAVCESHSFKPSLEGEAAVCITPLAQLAARPFAAAVLAGCDDNNLSGAPRLQGLWSRAQREALGMPGREAQAAELRSAWAHAMQIPHVVVLWSHAASDASGAGQSQQASPLLLNWKQTHEVLPRPDGRLTLELPLSPQWQPAPSAAVLALQKFSASSYADVRACPYRYFALRLLGLKEASEIDDSVEKRDFGSWLHAVLSDFHRQRPLQTNHLQDAELLDACAAAREKEQFAGDVGFIPFAASWPQVRESYLLWLVDHEKEGWQFEASELEAEQLLGDVTLHGRLDRVDKLFGSGDRLVIDYKTESQQALKERVKEPLEDTQLAFYATLLNSQIDSKEPSIYGGYLAISEKNAAKLIEQEQLAEALPIFMQGIALDAQRIDEGAGLPAHGEGATCDYCAARGLCRKDMRETV